MFGINNWEKQFFVCLILSESYTVWLYCQCWGNTANQSVSLPVIAVWNKEVKKEFVKGKNMFCFRFVSIIKFSETQRKRLSVSAGFWGIILGCGRALCLYYKCGRPANWTWLYCTLQKCVYTCIPSRYLIFFSPWMLSWI